MFEYFLKRRIVCGSKMGGHLILRMVVIFGHNANLLSLSIKGVANTRGDSA